MSKTIPISICIPAYKREAYLKRLLDSIAVQTFRDFEVVVTDDSPDREVEELCQQYHNQFVLKYVKNDPPLGTPANWNEGIRRAQGEWIKLMHDDDWFALPDSLKVFAQSAESGAKFIFSAYTNVFSHGAMQHIRLIHFWKKALIKNPMLLFAQNVIGPPSVTLVHKSIKELYDTRMKWRVDIDFYIRVLLKEAFHYIDEPLINVGISQTQVTNSCINIPDVELPEGLLMLQKYGIEPLRHILIYDTWWRLMRNTGVRKEEELGGVTRLEEWPDVIRNIIKHQAKIPQGLLRKGVISKSTMLVSYLLNRKYL